MIPADECNEEAAKEEFTGPETPADGLGPIFNAEGCGTCHLHPVLGAGSQIDSRSARHVDAPLPCHVDDVERGKQVLETRGALRDHRRHAATLERLRRLVDPSTVRRRQQAIELLSHLIDAGSELLDQRRHVARAPGAPDEPARRSLEDLLRLVEEPGLNRRRDLTVEFLDRLNSGNGLDQGRAVAVIGGGNTAVDAARANGVEPPAALLGRLAEKMPEPAAK